VEKIKTVVIVVLSIALCGAVIFSAFQCHGAESGARQIVDLENTNTQLRDGAAKDRETIERLTQQNEIQQRDYEQRISGIIESIGARNQNN
jgi:hypothetical protein